MSEHAEVPHRNEVHVVGRVSADAQPRTLPSGDEIVNCRIVVQSDRGSDTLECTAWTARTRRALLTWRKGDVVELEGSVRRRFWRTPAGAPASRYDIEVIKGRRLSR
jgi:single-strand DNA-binding protein